tara:strand:- start:490 stop:906 length:417 start_codon:yes stop_codon:yes gene_type:complete
MTDYIEATIIDVVDSADDVIADPDTVVIDVKEEIFKNNNYDCGFYISDSDSDIDSDIDSDDHIDSNDDELANQITAAITRVAAVAYLEVLRNEHNENNMTQEEIDEFEVLIQNKMLCCIALIIVGLIAAVFVYTSSKY